MTITAKNQLRAASMTDLKSSKLIVAKGVMFFCIAALSASLLIAEMPSVKVASLIVLLVWASCRFYYFLFYVLEHYVDPKLRYSGLLNLATAVRRRKLAGRNGV